MTANSVYDVDFEEVAEFLAEHLWIFDFKLTRIFQDDVFCNLPHEWKETFLNLSFEDLRDLPFGKIQTGWPDSLKFFIQNCLKFSLTREINHEKEKFGKITPVDVAKIDPEVRRGMSGKKLHEVCHMASLIDHVTRKNGNNGIIDVGSGLGYLGQVLHCNYGHSVIGLEGKQGHTTGADKRVNKFENCIHLHNVTCELSQQSQSQQEFLFLIQDWFSKINMNGNRCCHYKTGTKTSQVCDKNFQTGSISPNILQTGSKNTFEENLYDNNDIENPQNQLNKSSNEQSASKETLDDHSTSLPFDMERLKCKTRKTIKKGSDGTNSSTDMGNCVGTNSSMDMGDCDLSACTVSSNCSDTFCAPPSEKDPTCDAFETNKKQNITCNKFDDESAKAKTCLFHYNASEDTNVIKDANVNKDEQFRLKVYTKCADDGVPRQSIDDDESNTAKTCLFYCNEAKVKKCDADVIVNKDEQFRSKDYVRCADDSVPRLCMVGLHCCGDLTPTMLKHFVELDEITSLCCVSCCYHRMSFNEGAKQHDNFPMSNRLRRSMSNIQQKHPGFNFSSYCLRLAAQETRARWRQQTQEEHDFHTRNVAYRGILETCLQNDTGCETFQLKKNVRKLAHKQDYKTFTTYIAAVFKHIHRSDEVSTEELKKQFQERMQQKFDHHHQYLCLIEPLTALQYLLQPVMESLIYLDRRQWLQEQGLHAEIIPVFDEYVSPRNLALVAWK